MCRPRPSRNAASVAAAAALLWPAFAAAQTEDYGDAPDPTYPTLLASGGARHTVGSLYLGASVDAEADGQPTVQADGDDTNGSDDDDGVTFILRPVPGQFGVVLVTASQTGFLDAWVDFNMNGSWEHLTEHVISGYALSAGGNQIVFSVPADALTGATCARFRVSSAGGLTPSGAAADGEVEDHMVEVCYADYGDAPASYATLKASNGPWHVCDGVLLLGASADTELDGQPTAAADGDDTNGSDDEDGVTFVTELTPCFNATVRVEVNAACYLEAWVDFNANGSFADAGEKVADSVSLSSGINNLTFAVPAAAAMGQTFSRFRVSTMAGALITGPAPDGEVEDHALTISCTDYGDAPDPTYPTLLASDGARHRIDGVVYLGVAVDAEPNGQPADLADGDDAAGADDEDGVAFGGTLTSGQNAPINVTTSAACTLNAWIDFNGDGDWLDAGEHVFADQALTAGVNSLSCPVPAGAPSGFTYARFRASTDTGLAPTGAASDGEVEDYEVEVYHPPASDDDEVDDSDDGCVATRDGTLSSVALLLCALAVAHARRRARHAG